MSDLPTGSVQSQYATVDLLDDELDRLSATVAGQYNSTVKWFVEAEAKTLRLRSAVFGLGIVAAVQTGSIIVLAVVAFS